MRVRVLITMAAVIAIAVVSALWLREPLGRTSAAGDRVEDSIQDSLDEPSSLDEAALARATVQSTPRASPPERELARETRVPEWAGSMEDFLGELVAARIDERRTFERVECRASWCRVDTTHTSGDDIEALWTSILRGPERLRAARAEGELGAAGEDGRRRAVLYLHEPRHADLLFGEPLESDVASAHQE